MTYKRNSVLLTGVVVTLLGGCAHKPVPCPVPPPPSLMVPPESPATRERLMQLLPPTLPRVNETPNGSGDSSGG